MEFGRRSGGRERQSGVGRDIVEVGETERRQERFSQRRAASSVKVFKTNKM